MITIEDTTSIGNRNADRAVCGELVPDVLQQSSWGIGRKIPNAVGSYLAGKKIWENKMR